MLVQAFVYAFYVFEAVFNYLGNEKACLIL